MIKENLKEKKRELTKVKVEELIGFGYKDSIIAARTEISTEEVRIIRESMGDYNAGRFKRVRDLLKEGEYEK